MGSSQYRPPPAVIFDILARNADLDAALYEVAHQYPEIELDYLGELLIAYRRRAKPRPKPTPRTPSEIGC